jgi:hypothetical protein
MTDNLPQLESRAQDEKPMTRLRAAGLEGDKKASRLQARLHIETQLPGCNRSLV